MVIRSLKTPHIDSLAARGVNFSNFNVATPVCMPNRASVLTGRYPSVHGLRHNGLHLSVRETTFVELLRDAGYATALIGKNHVQPMTNGRHSLAPVQMSMLPFLKRRSRMAHAMIWSSHIITRCPGVSTSRCPIMGSTMSIW